jgi:hypothetical protein
MNQSIINLPGVFKRSFFLRLLVYGFLFLKLATTGYTQCGAGFTRDTVNWDNLDYLHQSGSFYGGTNPVTGLPFVTTAMKQTQYFSIGANRMTMATTIPVGGATTLWGDVTTHTGQTGAYGNGADIHFIKTGTAAMTITLTFQTEVRALKFSVFDIDQEITFAPTATNASGVAQSITLTKPAGATSAIPLNGSAAATTVTGTAPLANWATGGGSGTAYANTSNLGTVNVDIAGPVKTIVLTFSNDGNTNDFFLSDISACQPSAPFPTNYYQPYTQPFTGQPSYFLSAPQSTLGPNNNVYMINPVTGSAEFIFAEAVGTAINSMAYDPVNHWLYYVMDITGSAPGNVALKKYNFNTEPGTISTVIASLPAFGIPVMINGVESASAAFYNGSLYLGIEGENTSCFCTDVESMIWKIDFDGSGNPTTYSQVVGMIDAIGASDVAHNWGDISIKDGILISHASNNTTPLPWTNEYRHYNLETGNLVTYGGNSDTAGQLGQTWNGNIYRIRDSVALYNNSGGIGARTRIIANSCSPAWTGAAIDATDPFKPKSDFGDAPATYDPVALSPAVNQRNCNNATLRLGTTWDREWSKNTSVDASGDATDEDGITTVTILNSNGVSYNHVQSVTVTNNTGANATLGGWLDYNADGVFTATEGRIVTVPSTGSGTQTVNLSWNGLTIPPGTPNTFLRIRLVSGSTPMTTANFTGWYDDGEVEDYPVVSNNIPLGINLLDFNAYVTTDKTVELKWNAINDNDADGFEVQRSSDQNNWLVIGWKAAGISNNITNYNFTDQNPVTGTNYYRLKLIEKSGSSSYSIIKSVYTDGLKNDFRIAPNPANNNTNVIFTRNSNTTARLNVRNLSGQLLISRMITVKAGVNNYPVDVSLFAPGVYILDITTSEKSFTNKILVY